MSLKKEKNDGKLSSIVFHACGVYIFEIERLGSLYMYNV